MRKKILLLICCCAVLSACMTRRPAPVPLASPWDERVRVLQHSSSWQMDGRAAVTMGKQGWQASLDWNQSGSTSLVHLAGPFGVGALGLKNSPEGLSVNGAPPSDAVLADLQQRLGFELPLDELRFWLLGVPNPAEPFELVRNAQDRALELTQAGWTLDYDRYLEVAGQLLPGHLVMSREAVRVKIAVDHWQGVK
jgi:outer membrane lipoprotein LolB